MSRQQTQINQLAYAYGYRNKPNHLNELKIGDEVIIYDNDGNPCIQDLVESVQAEAIKVGGQWWYEFNYSARKI